MSSHETLTRAVVGTGHKLVQAGHFAARDVAARVQQLESAVGCLWAEAAQRRRRLQQAQEAQQFLMEVRGVCGAQRAGEGLRTPVYTGSDGDPRGVGSAFLLSPPPGGLLPSGSFACFPESRPLDWFGFAISSSPVVSNECFTSESPGASKKC